MQYDSVLCKQLGEKQNKKYELGSIQNIEQQFQYFLNNVGTDTNITNITSFQNYNSIQVVL